MIGGPAADAAHEVALAEPRIRRYVRETPLEPSPFLSRETGADVHLKLECVQVTGSFKVRGVLNEVLIAPAEVVERGIVCVSSGNTGRAVCYIAGQLGVPACVFLAARADPYRVKTLVDAGAAVSTVDGSFADASTAARRFADHRRMVFCSPGEDWAFIYGVGTVGIDIMRQVRVSTVYMPIGGGGLAAGIGTAWLQPALRRDSRSSAPVSSESTLRRSISSNRPSPLARDRWRTSTNNASDRDTSTWPGPP